MFDIIFMTTMGYLFFGFITCMFIVDYRTSVKVGFGVLLIWPLFAIKLILRGIKASTKGPMFVVGAVRGAMRELRDL